MTRSPIWPWVSPVSSSPSRVGYGVLLAPELASHAASRPRTSACSRRPSEFRRDAPACMSRGTSFYRPAPVLSRLPQRGALTQVVISNTSCRLPQPATHTTAPLARSRTPNEPNRRQRNWHTRRRRSLGRPPGRGYILVRPIRVRHSLCRRIEAPLSATDGIIRSEGNAVQSSTHDQQTQADHWLRLGAVARLAKVGRATAHRAATVGELPYAEVGGWRVFRRVDVEAWAARRAGGNAQPRG
jgi:hypothetical protein